MSMERIDVFFEEGRRRISRADKIILVASGKGGVGKSLISACLALSLSDLGRKVGVLDLDVHGPSIPNLLNLRDEIRATKDGFNPAKVWGLEVMSLGLLTGDLPIPLRGEHKRSLISMLTALTNWGKLDYLVVDLPPGTGDETIWSIRSLRGFNRGGAILVTIPSILSLSVVKRTLKLLSEEGLRILGVVENMSHFKCGNDVVRPFGSIHLEELGVNILGRIPIDPSIEEAISKGEPPHKASFDIQRIFMELARVVERSMR